MTNPIRGRTIRWTFLDGAMANKTFEHTFGYDGTVTWRMVADDAGGPTSPPSRERKYEAAQVTTDVVAVSYLGTMGSTLTVVLDMQTGTLVAFSSNEKELAVQRGIFELTTADASEETQPWGDLI